MINNYKAQRNVRAELSGTVDLGEPVSLYIAEDEIKITGNNLINNGAYKDYAVTGAGGWTKYGDNVITTTDTSVRIASDGSGNEQGAFIYFRDNADTKSMVDSDLKIGTSYVFSCFMETDSSTAHLELTGGTDANGTTGTGQKELRFTAGSVDGQYLRLDQLDTGATKYVELTNIKLYEVTDHTYKLMAVTDTIPSNDINSEAVGSDIITNGAFDSGDDWTEGTGWAIGSGKATCSANNNNLVQTFDIISGRVYRLTFEIEDFSSGWVVCDIGRGTATEHIYGDGVKTVDITAGSGVEDIRFYGGAFRGAIDDVVVKELYGYDYYNAPAYKFGIVSSVYDQDTGAMKSTGAAGDQLEVTVQGECNVVRTDGSNQNVDKDKIIKKILNDGEVSDESVNDNMLPNAVGVITETNSSTTTAKIILFQGVDFSEHFVHKNSLQVKAKCSETITKFRPVSLYLDSAGDLLCRHDDIPEEAPESNEDLTGVDPGKWGISELGGASGEIIPVTVAGKTHINTPSTLTAGKVIYQILEAGNSYSSNPGASKLPGGIATIMESGTGDVPITIFGGTPIGTISDWKRTIKITANANGTVTQYCPVSLYLDQYGNYKCLSDDIPYPTTSNSNAVWVDFRKWGIAQTTVADGEDVEIIVQGRTNVHNATAAAAREEYIIKISDSGTVTATDSGGYQLSMLGIVEKEARVADGQPGVIIIF